MWEGRAVIGDAASNANDYPFPAAVYAENTKYLDSFRADRRTANRD